MLVLWVCFTWLADLLNCLWDWLVIVGLVSGFAGCCLLNYLFGLVCYVGNVVLIFTVVWL